MCIIYIMCCIIYRLFEPIGEIDVELNIPVTFLYVSISFAKYNGYEKEGRKDFFNLMTHILFYGYMALDIW